MHELSVNCTYIATHLDKCAIVLFYKIGTHQVILNDNKNQCQSNVSFLTEVIISPRACNITFFFAVSALPCIALKKLNGSRGVLTNHHAWNIRAILWSTLCSGQYGQWVFLQKFFPIMNITILSLWCTWSKCTCITLPPIFTHTLFSSVTCLYVGPKFL